jgi:hypothetical protein
MATLNAHGKNILSILKKIKEYPEYKKHLPIINNGQDIFTSYVDYHLAISNNKVADVLFIETIMPFPGFLGNHDYMIVVLSPEDVTITYDASYYDFDSEALEPPDTIGIDIPLFYRALLRSMEYGCLNWGVPFRRYALKIGYAVYTSGIKSIDTRGDDIFTVTGYKFSSNEINYNENEISSYSYDNINTFYIPKMYLSAIGIQLGIYPDAIAESYNNLLHERSLFSVPPLWLSAKGRRKKLMLPYSFGQVVYDQDIAKSYISLIDDNSELLDSEAAWKEIKYHFPLDTTQVPQGMANPLEALLTLFNKTFDLSTLKA